MAGGSRCEDEVDDLWALDVMFEGDFSFAGVIGADVGWVEGVVGVKN